ncbi:MAG: hypothetical protein IPM96_00275 [Ignavibacteria bacterium]|nr:hypothetical protein [Ignavibacteria bacterium]
MRKILLSVITLVFVLTFYSCSSVTEMSGTWKKPATIAKKYNKIIVMGVSSNIVAKSKVENAIVSQLKKSGINAVAGTNVISTTMFDSDGDGKADPEKQEIVKEKMKELGVDGALVISVLDIKEEERYVPGSTYYSPYNSYYPFYNYYYGSYNMVNTPGYYTKSTNVFLTSNFYDVTTEDLIWSAQSETLNPASISDLASSYSERMVEDFLSSGIVRK